MAAEMSLFRFSDVMDLQSMEIVVGPLNEGIVSICNIYKFLSDAQVDPTTGTCSNYAQIRGHIVYAEQCLKNSETMIKEKLQYLDECMEQFIIKKGNAEQQNKEKSMAMDELNIKKKSAEESLKNSKVALKQAKNYLALRKKEIRKAENRKVTGGWMTAAGIGITIIPLAGWIAGPMMVCHGISTMVVASKAISDAENKLKENESQVKYNERKVTNYQSKICNIQNEIEETNKVLYKIQVEIEVVKQHLKKTNKIQEKVRSAVHHLSVLSRRVTGLERQTRRSILWHPVMNVIEETMKRLQYSADNHLVFSIQGVAELSLKSRPPPFTEFFVFSLCLLTAIYLFYFI